MQAPLATLQAISFGQRPHFWRPLRPVLRAVTLEVPAGACFGLLGPNGAGKTTLVRVLLGLVRPTAGRAAVGGHAAGSAAAGRLVGYVPERACLPGHLGALDYVALHAALAGHGPRAARARARAALADVGLEAAPTRLGALSKGTAQRVSLAQALVGDPALLVLDEPTSGLDPAGRAALRLLLARLCAEGRTLLICTHALADAEALCSHVAMLAAGRVRLAGALSTLLASAPGAWRLVLAGLPKGAGPSPAAVDASADVDTDTELHAAGGRRTLMCADLAAANRCIDWARELGAQVVDLRRSPPPLAALYAQATAATDAA